MKTIRDSHRREFLRIYIVPIVLIIGVVLTGVFTVIYTMTSITQDGRVVENNWPKEFTHEFSQYISTADGSLTVADEGLERLRDNGLWLQILDDACTEMYSCSKPDSVPDSYMPYELLELYQNGSDGYSVFISRYSVDEKSYIYLIGFPLSIEKVVMYVDLARYSYGRYLIAAVVLLTIILVITLTVYSYRTFSSARQKREQDDKAKEEWLANITHDLKTPLAPIRGYAELLQNDDCQSSEQTRRYGSIILRNVLHTEQLVDDLKLTYQLQSNMLPLCKVSQNLVRFVREVIIDILNLPDYEGRVISFINEGDKCDCCFDPKLLRRALTNILVNALKHNTPDTEVTVTVSCGDGARLTILDNGSGMTAEELDGLFKRYYRGTSTDVKAEGTGLGMAIARQIVEAHGGEINAESSAGNGTTISIRLP